MRRVSGDADSWWTDRSHLREQQYRTDDNLAARRSIYAYQQPRHDLPAVVLDAAELSGAETVLDVGCGPGTYLAALGERGHAGPALGVDLSEGMLTSARTRAPRARFAVGDIMRLPVVTGSADVVLATHVLYHALDPRVAIGELRRAAAPGGTVILVLNRADHLTELRALLSDTGEDQPSLLSGEARKVTVERATQMLVDVFPSVTQIELRGRLLIPDEEPVLTYARSTMRGQLTTDWSAFRARLRERLTDQRTFEVTTHSGVLVCR
jgi:SAM-dependent methyltransferase